MSLSREDYHRLAYVAGCLQSAAAQARDAGSHRELTAARRRLHRYRGELRDLLELDLECTPEEHHELQASAGNYIGGTIRRRQYPDDPELVMGECRFCGSSLSFRFAGGTAAEAVAS